ncbi:MAG: hypothetical protein JWN24_5058, partial [Phycisphaerales bacterium]|nr:hypothetical protein [Phycisphaerales bacterium]
LAITALLAAAEANATTLAKAA